MRHVCSNIVIIIACDGIESKKCSLLIPLHIFLTHLDWHWSCNPNTLLTKAHSRAELHHTEIAPYLCCGLGTCVALLPSALCSTPCCYPWMFAHDVLTGCTFTTHVNPAATCFLVFLYTHSLIHTPCKLGIDCTVCFLYKSLHKSFSLENGR